MFFSRKLVAPKTGAIVAGSIFLPMYFFGLSIVLGLLFYFLDIDTTATHGMFVMQFVHSSVTVIAVLLIFRNFLKDSIAPLGERSFGRFMLDLVIGYGACVIMANTLAIVYEALSITPPNENNDLVFEMLLHKPIPMAFTVVILAPIIEECLFRGILFAPLCRKCPIAAYIVSSVVFAGLHIIAGIGVNTPFELFLCFLQYLPHSLVLAWVYQRTRSIWGSIALHAMINAISTVGMFATSLLENLGG